MTMICPYCGKEMLHGYIQSRDGVFWTEEKTLLSALSFFKRGATPLSNDPDLLSSAVVAYMCRSCKKVVIDFDCP
ncbi:MAG: PF20097 family protein [Clostridia bacterium]|nr:PF20097 family protein [Clostridia bacterium]